MAWPIAIRPRRPVGRRCRPVPQAALRAGSFPACPAPGNRRLLRARRPQTGDCAPSRRARALSPAREQTSGIQRLELGLGSRIAQWAHLWLPIRQERRKHRCERGFLSRHVRTRSRQKVDLAVTQAARDSLERRRRNQNVVSSCVVPCRWRRRFERCLDFVDHDVGGRLVDRRGRCIGSLPQVALRRHIADRCHRFFTWNRRHFDRNWRRRCCPRRRCWRRRLSLAFDRHIVDLRNFDRDFRTVRTCGWFGLPLFGHSLLFGLRREILLPCFVSYGRCLCVDCGRYGGGCHRLRHRCCHCDGSGRRLRLTWSNLAVRPNEEGPKRLARPTHWPRRRRRWPKAPLPRRRSACEWPKDASGRGPVARWRL